MQEDLLDEQFQDGSIVAYLRGIKGTPNARLCHHMLAMYRLYNR